MFVKQLSVFLENTEGRLDEVLKILAQGGIDLLSASLADTMEYGVLRLLAKDPDKAKQILKEAGYDGWLSVEFEGIEDCLMALKADIDNLRGMIAAL